MQVSSTQSSNFVTSNYSTLELKDPNNSIDYTPPVGVIETASDFVQSYPFSFTGILSSNYTTAISPLNSKSPTLGAFFMSGMENPSTVKSVTHIHLQYVLLILLYYSLFTYKYIQYFILYIKGVRLIFHTFFFITDTTQIAIIYLMIVH